ncbi:MAG: hypothetical protein RLW61_04555 [Gammaproteobacteria bacterium]
MSYRRNRRRAPVARSKVYADIAGALLVVSSVAAFAAWFHLARVAGAL